MRTSATDKFVKGGVPRTKNVLFHGHTLRLYSIGWLSLMTRLAQVTLRLWERQGVLPPPFIKLAKPVPRWYCPLELQAYSNVIGVHFQSDRDKRVLRENLHASQIDIRRIYKNAAKTKTFYPALFTLKEETTLIQTLHKEIETMERQGNEVTIV